MRTILHLIVLQTLAACTSGAGAVRDPGSPTPVAPPGAGGGDAPRPASTGRAGGSDRRLVPVRPEEAPLVTVREIVDQDSLIGRRVRVSGVCAKAGAGRSKGSWILSAEAATIEVRGLVPPSCSPSGEHNDTLTIFAQIEPKEAESAERLLLRLPD